MTPIREKYRVVPYDNATHRKETIKLLDSVFGYEAEHNRPELVIDKKLQAQDRLFFVALGVKEVVGSVMAGYDGHRGWLYSLAVYPRYRRRGIGSALLRHAETVLIKQGCVKINLQIVTSNDVVCDFYRALGYDKEERLSMGKRIPQNVIPPP